MSLTKLHIFAGVPPGMIIMFGFLIFFLVFLIIISVAPEILFGLYTDYQESNSPVCVAFQKYIDNMRIIDCVAYLSVNPDTTEHDIFVHFTQPSDQIQSESLLP